MKTPREIVIRRIMFGILVLVIFVCGYFIYSKLNNDEDSSGFFVVKKDQFLNQVSVTGKVIPRNSADLNFDQSGRISLVHVKTGDSVVAGKILAELEAGDLRAELKAKQANLEREKAKLDSLMEGVRPEEIAVYEQKYLDASKALVIAMKSSYSQMEDAIINKADFIFTNGSSANPLLNFSPAKLSDNEKRSIENERLVIREILNEWKDLKYDSSSETSLSAAKEKVLEYQTHIKAFVSRIGNLVLDLSNSGLSQSTIEQYRSSLNLAAQSVDGAMTSEQAADAAWSSARESLALQMSGSRPSEVLAQRAQVSSAEADLQNVQARLAKALIVAPFDGIITRVDAKLGESVTPSANLVGIIENTNFEIEAFVPEIHIASVKMNDAASVTLDAYGSEVEFSAKVISIDPAETMRDGVSMYRVKLGFDSSDSRIRSGMTANVVITTDKRDSVIVLPKGVIYTADNQKFVQIKNGDSLRLQAVQVGSSSATGLVEIISGVSEGMLVKLEPDMAKSK